MYRLIVNDVLIVGLMGIGKATELMGLSPINNIEASLSRDGHTIFTYSSGEWFLVLSPRLSRIDWIVWYREHENQTYSYAADKLGISRQAVRAAYLKYQKQTAKRNLLGEY